MENDLLRLRILKKITGGGGVAGPVSSIYISGVRTSVIRSMRKVKPSESKMAAIDVQ